MSNDYYYYSYTADPNNNYHINIPYNSDNTEDYYICGYYYYYDWKEDMISRLKKIIEELINMPPIKIPIWIYENYDLLKELGIEVKKKKEDNKKEV